MLSTHSQKVTAVQDWSPGPSVSLNTDVDISYQADSQPAGGWVNTEFRRHVGPRNFPQAHGCQMGDDWTAPGPYPPKGWGCCAPPSLSHPGQDSPEAWWVRLQLHPGKSNWGCHSWPAQAASMEKGM